MAKEDLEKAKQTVSDMVSKINAIDAKMAEFQLQYKKLQQMRRNGVLFCAKTLKPLNDEGRDLCLEGISEKLNDEIRANMFMFSDLALLDKRDLQKILFKCSIDDLAYAIKLLDNTPEKKSILSNVSKNNLQMILQKEWKFVAAVPEDENGFTNSNHNISFEDFQKTALPAMINFSKGIGLHKVMFQRLFIFFGMMMRLSENSESATI